jgi:hypothetical protein
MVEPERTSQLVGRRRKVAKGEWSHEERLSYQMGFWNVEGNHAYAVISGTLTIKLR